MVISFLQKRLIRNKMLDKAKQQLRDLSKKKIFFQSTIFFLFLFFFRINVLTSSLTSVSKSFNISRIRSPSELEAVDNASGDLLAMIGDDNGVSKSSNDNGLVNGLGIIFLLLEVEVF